MAKRVAFCGVGALGSTAAVLTRNVDAELRFIDFDRVESKNLLSHAYVKQSVGKNKAEALKLKFSNFFAKKAEAFGVRLTSANAEALLGESDLLVDCFDNIESRRLLSDFARRTGKPLIHAALSGDGTFGMVRWDEHFAPDAEDRAGQATCEGGEHLPIIGLIGAALARAVQDFVSKGHRSNFMIGLDGARAI